MTNTEESGISKNLAREIPFDNPSDFFVWLKRYHDPEIVDSLPYDQNPPQAFDYDGITPEALEVAIKAVQDQRSQEPETMQRLLKNLSPAQIILLSNDPTRRLYTEQEMIDLTKKEVREEKERLSKFPDTKEVVKVEPGTVKFLHSTRGDIPEHNYVGDIMTNGLFCHDDGLSGVAVRLAEENEDHNLGVLAYRHRGYPGVISVVLPLPQSEDLREKVQRTHRPGIGARVGIDGFLAREISEEKKVRMHGAGIDYYYFIPGKFIEGFFDSQKGEFTRNPNFDPNLSDDDLKHIEKRFEELTK